MTPPEPYRGLNAALARNSGPSAEAGREGRAQGGLKSEMGRAAYWRMNYESAIQALADLIAENTENVDLLKQAAERIRHDHGYPMEVGPHHCEGCDLEAKIRAARPTVTPPAEPGADQ